jgi:hypothetical protein
MPPASSDFLFLVTAHFAWPLQLNKNTTTEAFTVVPITAESTGGFHASIVLSIGEPKRRKLRLRRAGR